MWRNHSSSYMALLIITCIPDVPHRMYLECRKARFGMGVCRKLKSGSCDMLGGRIAAMAEVSIDNMRPLTKATRDEAALDDRKNMKEYKYFLQYDDASSRAIRRHELHVQHATATSDQELN